jgi:outer membrane murein-binding lipoprotein Lpp
MNRKTVRRALAVGVLAVSVSAFLVPAAVAAPTPEVRALQRQVRTLQAQVATLRSQVNALRASVGAAAAQADAANTAATTAGQNATTAVTKTNCLVNATAVTQWNNDVYGEPPSTLFLDTGLSFSSGSDPVSAYVAGINASCVPSVFQRAGAASFSAFSAPFWDGALLSPH